MPDQRRRLSLPAACAPSTGEAPLATKAGAPPVHQLVTANANWFGGAASPLVAGPEGSTAYPGGNLHTTSYCW